MRLKRVLIIVSFLLCASCSQNKTSERKKISYESWVKYEQKFTYELPTSADVMYDGEIDLNGTQKYKNEKRHYDIIDGSCSPYDELKHFVLLRADAIYRGFCDPSLYEITYYNDLSLTIECCDDSKMYGTLLPRFKRCTLRFHSSGYVSYIKLSEDKIKFLDQKSGSVLTHFTVDITYN